VTFIVDPLAVGGWALMFVHGLYQRGGVTPKPVLFGGPPLCRVAGSAAEQITRMLSFDVAMRNAIVQRL